MTDHLLRAGMGRASSAASRQPPAASRQPPAASRRPWPPDLPDPRRRQGRYQIDHAWHPRHGPVTVACDGQRRWQVYPDKVTTGPAEPLPRFIRDLADPSWLLRCWLSGGTTIQSAGRPAWRINAGRRPGDESLAQLFPAAVAVVDTELRLVLLLTSYIGTRAVQRLELRDVTTDTGDFQVQIPAGLPVVEEPGRS